MVKPSPSDRSTRLSAKFDSRDGGRGYGREDRRLVHVDHVDGQGLVATKIPSVTCTVTEYELFPAAEAVASNGRVLEGQQAG